MKNKILSILLSAVIAFGMWLFVITVEQPESEETYYDIPVVLQYEDVLTERGLMLVSERPAVTLKLASTRSNLNSLNESNINVIANLSNISAAGTYEINYTLSYPGSIPASAVTVLSSSVDMVSVKVEKRITKNVPVVPEYIGSVAEGLLADKENAILDYETIEVSGPESVMERITQAKIEVDLTDQAETFVGEYVYTLCDEAGEPVDSAWVTTNAEMVSLTLKIQRVKEITLKLNVVAGGGATEQTSSIDIQPKTIRISGSEALLEGLEELEIGTIDLGDMLADETLTFPIVLPEGVTNETGIAEATVEVKFPNLRTKTFNVTNIQVINVPEGFAVDMITQVLEVKVRGPVAMINAMSEEDITITVDFTDAQLGTATMKPTITISSKYDDVGAVGSYSVSATVQEADGKGEA